MHPSTRDIHSNHPDPDHPLTARPSGLNRIPASTYRIQFRPGFGFREAKSLIPYLSELGITEVYAAPIFASRAGSPHGYDIVDPNRLNPELGTIQDFEALIEEVKRHDLGWIQDIVPNHMAFDPMNALLMDVLEAGPDSKYYQHFDIDWEHPDPRLRGRLLAPFLGKPFDQALLDGEILIGYEVDGFKIQYYSLKFPLRIQSYDPLLNIILDQVRDAGNGGDQDLPIQNLRQALDEPLGPSKAQALKARLREGYSTHAGFKKAMEQALGALKETASRSHDSGLLDRLLNEQNYRLAFWKTANHLINYRRFFTINEMISVNIQEPQVFTQTHTLISQLCRESKFTGLRVDHIDGLYDPLRYLKQLRSSMGNLYVVAEKILGRDEEFCKDWPIQGTTGYEFLNVLNGIFCDTKNEKAFDSLYTKFSGQKDKPEALIYRNKKLVMKTYMNGDIENLARLFMEATLAQRPGNDLVFSRVKEALAEIIAHFPVYRTYLDSGGIARTERTYLRSSVKKAKATQPDLTYELNLIGQALEASPESGSRAQLDEEWLPLAMRFQQVTGPLMAKGFEDTTLYVYNRLLSLNEVGGFPDSFGLAPDFWHRFHSRRISRWPHTMNTSSTHDTKRGEDARARINVLSELPAEWKERLGHWQTLNKARKPKWRRIPVPPPNVEYFLYQTMIGAFPFTEQEMGSFPDRIKEYFIKAQREAKVYSDWLEPQEGYESGLRTFIDALLSSGADNLFLADFKSFQEKIAFYGILNSLSQTLLKITAPGVPDFYQGTELWDLSLVDPDNRRPVDFDLRQRVLSEIRQKWAADRDGLLAQLWTQRADGRIKMFLIHQALQARKLHPLLFGEGSYLPLKASGTWENHIVAFARKHQDRWAITVVPRLLTPVIPPGVLPGGHGVWKDTHLSIPEQTPTAWSNAISGEGISGGKSWAMGDLLRQVPVALLISEDHS